MKSFLALTIVTFWLTIFPLKGPLLPESSLFLVFLFFHSLGYLNVYFFYNYFLEKKFILFSLIVTVVLTFLFPFLTQTYKKICISLIGLFSPPWIVYALSFLRQEITSLWPYSGLIFGNLLTYLLSLIIQENYFIYYIFVGSILLILYFIKKNSKDLTNTQPIYLDLRKIDYFLLYSGIFFYYLISPLLYEVFTTQHWLYSDKDIHINLIFYSLGVISSFYFLKFTKLDKKDLLILSSSLLSIVNIFLHFKKELSIILGKSILFLSSGIMDFITLFLFIKFFKDLKKLALLFCLVSLSLLVSNVLYSMIFVNKNHLFPYVSIISLLCILFFYKLNLKFTLEERLSYSDKVDIIEKDIPTSNDKEAIIEEKVTPELLYEKINQKLDSNIKKLSKRECEVIYYFIFENKNITEVSQILEISRSSAREYLKRACIKLGTNQHELRNLIEDLLKR